MKTLDTVRDIIIVDTTVEEFDVLARALHSAATDSLATPIVEEILTRLDLTTEEATQYKEYLYTLKEEEEEEESMITIEEMQDYLMDYGIATREELELVSAINGHNEQTYEDILYVRTGYHSFDQWMESEVD